MVAPLIWLLIFDLIVCAVWWVVFNLLGVGGPPKLLQVMGGIVIIINAVILIVWLLAFLGVAPGEWMQGPYPRGGR